MRLLLLAAFAVGCGSSNLQWSRRADMPISRTEHALLSSGGKLYALGGYSRSTLAEVDEYDPASDRWTRRADMNAPRRTFVAGAIGGKLYVACGANWSGDPNSVQYPQATEVYDPAADKWTTAGAACPVGAVNPILGNFWVGGAAVGNALILVAFATGGTNGTASTWSYDPAADRWSEKAPPPFTYVRWAGAGASGTLYALGSGDTYGRFADDAAQSLLASYDPIANRWTLQQPLPGIWHPALVSANGAVFALGGELADVFGGVTALPSVMEFTPGPGWRHRGGLRLARASAAAAELNGFLYVSGGSSAVGDDLTPPAPLASVEAAPVQ